MLKNSALLRLKLIKSLFCVTGILGLLTKPVYAQGAVYSPFNQAPELKLEQKYTARVNEVLEFTVKAVDETSKSVALICELESAEPLEVIGAKFIDFGDKSGHFRFIPTESFAGKDLLLSFSAKDDGGLTTEEIVTIHIKESKKSNDIPKDLMKLNIPEPGTIISESEVTFKWSGSPEIQDYLIDVGTKPGKLDIFSKHIGLKQKITVPSIPLNGKHIYVRLWYGINRKWYKKDFSFLTMAESGHYIQMTQPANGATLNSPIIQMTWEDNCSPDTYYTLKVGTSRRKSNIHNESLQGKKTALVPFIPLDGNKVYVTLKTDESCQKISQDFVYYTIKDPEWMKEQAIPATMVTPVNGTTIKAAPVYFRWNNVLGATRYKLFIGTEPGASDVFRMNLYKCNNIELSRISQNLEKIYVRLWTYIYQQWVYQDYAYPIGDPEDVLAHLISPSPGSTIYDEAINFVWTPGLNVKKYRIEVGTKPGKIDLLKKRLWETQKSIKLKAPYPKNIYVRLWSYLNDEWIYEDEYQYKINISGLKPAQLLKPDESEKITSQAIHFKWQDKKEIEKYSLTVGSQFGLANIFEKYDLTQTEIIISNTDPNIKYIYVQLGSLINGDWLYQNYVFTVEQIIETNVRMISPEPGTTLPADSLIVFEWSNVKDVTEHKINIGSKPGLADLHEEILLNQNYFILPEIQLPEDTPNKLYVRLWSNKDEQWQYSDYEYFLEAQEREPTPLLGQIDGIFIINSKLWFKWKTTEIALEHRVQMGTEYENWNLFDQMVGKTNILEIDDFKTEAEKIYIRLWTRTKDGWSFVDQEFVLE